MYLINWDFLTVWKIFLKPITINNTFIDLTNLILELPNWMYIYKSLQEFPLEYSRKSRQRLINHLKLGHNFSPCALSRAAFVFSGGTGVHCCSKTYVSSRIGSTTMGPKTYWVVILFRYSSAYRSEQLGLNVWNLLDKCRY